MKEILFLLKAEFLEKLISISFFQGFERGIFLSFVK